MALPGPGNCAMCRLPMDVRLNLECQILRGDTYESISQPYDFSLYAVRNHFVNGHVKIDLMVLREWMQKNNMPPEKQLEKRRQSFLDKLLAQPEEVNQQMISATLLMCANEAHELLQSMKDREDYRGSVAAVESLRRISMDLASLKSLKTTVKEEDVIESQDVTALRESVMDEIRRRTGDTPG